MILNKDAVSKTTHNSARTHIISGLLVGAALQQQMHTGGLTADSGAYQHSIPVLEIEQTASDKEVNGEAT